MINDIIDELIKTAMKAKNTLRTETYRAIKSAFLNWKTDKANVGKEMTKTDEINTLKKMVKQRQDSVEQYMSAKREDLAKYESDQITILKEFLPEEVTEEQIENMVEGFISKLGHEPSMKDMGMLIKSVKVELPNADGSLVAKVVKSKLC